MQARADDFGAPRPSGDVGSCPPPGGAPSERTRLDPTSRSRATIRPPPRAGKSWVKAEFGGPTGEDHVATRGRTRLRRTRCLGRNQVTTLARLPRRFRRRCFPTLQAATALRLTGTALAIPSCDAVAGRRVPVPNGRTAVALVADLIEWPRLTDTGWRRGRDSNPRYTLTVHNGLANRRLQPLGHPSARVVCHAGDVGAMRGESSADIAGSTVRQSAPWVFGGVLTTMATQRTVVPRTFMDLMSEVPDCGGIITSAGSALIR